MIRRAYCDIASGQIHYRYAGDASKTPLILLHQSPSSSIMYETLMRELGNDYWLLAPDTPGFGQSDPLAEPVSIAAYADAIQQFCTALRIEQALLFGHHTGASVAVQLAYDNPELSLAMALSGPTLLSDALKAALPGKAKPFPLTEDGSHLLGMWQRMRDKEPDAPLALSLRETLLGLEVGDAYPEAYRAVIDQPFGDQLKALECPVLVFAGTGDPLYGMLDEAAQLLKHGEKQEIDGARTYACDLHAKTIGDMLKDFFRRNAGKA
ncbi:pimeloyl-ACP methyl ester carboxylesterase [Litorivivens lipolytica]|uniref:Pimeloyl-ACP methyl ester carboxylesterase n=1 Tax=Litorivivens lipolytica TaxID=1524264 RepID=A0A7W4Z683_9GAMM|nr:pimeloyl-ACP methyl ester carboxylesterase [Litorivivens lipolytica]